MEIRIPATTRFTEALIKSKAGSLAVTSSLLRDNGTNLELIRSIRDEGRLLVMKSPRDTPDFTNKREARLGLNFSVPAPWRDKLMVVSVTVLAFLDSQSVATIIPPDIINIRDSAGTFCSSTDIEN